MANFNRLWVGQTVSLLGTALSTFALPTLAILVLHATALQVGVLTALERLPFPIFGMLAGVIADRHSRRNIMIVADVMRFAVLAIVSFSGMLGILNIPLLYGVALVTGIASVFFDVSYQSYLPVIVTNERLTDANVKLEISHSGANMAGTAVAGVLVQWVGALFAIGVDAISYIVSVVSLAMIRAPEAAYTGPPLSLRQLVREMQEGLVLVFGSRDLRAMLYATAIVNFASSMVFAIALIYAYRILGLQPGILGVVFAFAEIGFVGALLATRIRNWLGLRATLIAMLLVIGTADACMLLAQLGLPYFVILLTAMAIVSSITVYNVIMVSYRQALIDVAMQGRVNATMRTFMWGTVPLGALVGGSLGTLFGVPVTIATSAILTGVAALALTPVRDREQASL